MPPTARAYLKAATAAAHDGVDALFSQFDLSDRGDYGQFLQAQAGAVLAIEAAVDAAGAERLIRDWPQRRRADVLGSDMADLGLSSPTVVAFPAPAAEAAVLGAVYVLEGSRLGGALLERSVSPDFPRRFLSPGNPLLWRAFVSVLEERLSSQEARAEAARSAATAFDAFSQSARRTLGAPTP